MSNNLYYTGVGSRSTPPYICELMTNLGTLLESCGYILRSGGAQGADTAFERGVLCQTNKEIWLPWLGFNSNSSTNIPTQAAYDIAATVHPVWDDLKETYRLLHARNIHQVLGENLNTPSNFLVCWTEDGKTVGGTATAIRLARRHDIPIINIGSFGDKPDDIVDRLECALASADPQQLLNIRI